MATFFIDTQTNGLYRYSQRQRKSFALIQRSAAMAKSFKPAYLSLITFDADLDDHIEALEDEAKLAAAANEPESSFNEIMEMVGGKRSIPFCVNMSAATADRLVTTRWAA